MHRGAVAHIELDSIKHNLGIVRACAPGCAVYAVVKADAYGHGAVEVSKTLLSAGADRLAVAFCNEAAPLREAGIRKPILSLFDSTPDEVFRYNLIPVVNDFSAAERLSKAAVARDIKLPVHVKIDTGMGRTGIINDPAAALCGIVSLKGITVEGVTSHLSESEASDREFSLRQISIMKDLRNSLEQKGLIIPYFHMSNSGAIINLPEGRFDAVRAGLMLYGYSPVKNAVCRVHEYELRPAMKLTAKLVQLRRVPAGATISYNRTFTARRDSLIGAVSVGYADGYSVAFSNNSEVLVRGRRAPLIGRVCMDIIMIDLTDIEDVSMEDEVVLLGRQGDDCITASELADRIKTHPYEILTSLGSRARKVYI
jgi:alanine racemase